MLMKAPSFEPIAYRPAPLFPENVATPLSDGHPHRQLTACNTS